MIEIFVLLIAFQVKHLVADYYLQLPFMYEGKGKSTNWTLPLTSHVMIHATITFTIAIIFVSIQGFSIWLPFIAFSLDFTTHFIIDRWKATRRSQIDESQFWYNLGIDQMLHHLVGIGIIALLVL